MIDKTIDKTIEETAVPVMANQPFEIKKGYNYSWDQYREFIGTSDVLIMDGVDFPQYCTLIPAPQPKSGFITTFDIDADKWIYVEDVRGKEMYHTETKMINYCYELRIPDGWTFIPYDDFVYDEWDGKKWVFNKTRWQADQTAEADRLRQYKRGIAEEYLHEYQSRGDDVKAQAWEQYIKELDELDTSKAPDIIFPKFPEDL